MNSFKNHLGEDLRKWFKQKWVRMDTKGNIRGDCAREEGEGKPKCLPSAKAHSMSKEDRAAAAKRKRREDPVADRPGKGGKPINVRTEEMHLKEGNKPTNPDLWSRAKALARSKFDVYPSAYANGWAAKWYKSKGGGWKSVSEGVDDEGGMAKGELNSIASKAKELAKMMKKNKQLDAWVQSKISKSDDYIGSVHDYLKNNKQEVDEDRMKKTFFQFKEEINSCCDECSDDSMYGSVEEDFEPTGNEEYEDWGLEEAQTPLQYILKNPGKEYPPFDPDPPKKNKPAGDEAKHGGMSRAKHLAQMMKNKMNKMKEDLDEAKDTETYKYIDQSGGQVIKGKSGTYVGYTHSATKGKGANILKHNNTKKYYAAGGSSTAFTAKTTLHDTPEDAARAYHKGNLAEASPMIKPPKNEFAKKEDAFAHAKQHGGKVMKKTFTHPTSGMQTVSYVVREDTEQIDELKRTTLANYVSKAAGSYGRDKQNIGRESPDGTVAKARPELKRAVKNRLTGINRAAERLAKEETEIDEASKKPNATTRHLRDYPVSDKDMAKPITYYSLVHKATNKVLSTHKDLESAKDEHRGMDQGERAHYRIATSTKAPKSFDMTEEAKGVAEGYTGRETKDGTWRVFKDGQAVAVAGPFNSRDEAHAWIKKHKQGVAEASSLAQQAAIAIAMKKAGKKPKNVSEENLEEAEKNGKRVQLNKPFRTSDGKGKFAVYAKNEKGNVVKVNFGDTTGLTIKTSNPDRRRNFRARHNCDNPGPKHKARYWSCRAWSRGTVSAGLGT